MTPKQIAQILHTPLGPRMIHSQDPVVLAGREAIQARYYELGKEMGFDAASLQARAEWINTHLTGDTDGA